jgi:hypothetical protein
VLGRPSRSPPLNLDLRPPDRRKRRPLSSRPFHRPPRGHVQKPLRNANALPLASGSHTSLTASPAPAMRARSSYFALDFLFRTRAGFVESLRTYCTSSTRPAWHYHVPRIWNRSINGCEFPVKRKTQNVVDVLVPRLFVVVPFLRPLVLWQPLGTLASRATLVASNPL